jgi:hypothetical protein
MGQKATKAEMVYTETYCRDMKVFIEALGLQPSEWEQRPAMHPQYNMAVAEHKADEFEGILKQLLIAGKPIEYRRKDTFFSIDLGHKNLTDAQVQFKGKTATLESLGLSNEAIDDETGSTAYHVKEGILLIYDPQRPGNGTRQHEISTRAIVPSILENFGVPVPAYMIDQRIK